MGIRSFSPWIDEVWIREVVVFAQFTPSERIFQMFLAEMPEGIALFNGDERSAFIAIVGCDSRGCG